MVGRLRRAASLALVSVVLAGCGSGGFSSPFGEEPAPPVNPPIEAPMEAFERVYFSIRATCEDGPEAYVFQIVISGVGEDGLVRMVTNPRDGTSLPFRNILRRRSTDGDLIQPIDYPADMLPTVVTVTARTGNIAVKGCAGLIEVHREENGHGLIPTIGDKDIELVEVTKAFGEILLRVTFMLPA